MFVMKKLLSFLFIALTAVSTGHAYVNRATAVVTLLDKAAGKTHVLEIPVGQAVAYEKISLLARTCKQTDPFQPENAFMFIEISQNNSLVFSGWMNKNDPGKNPLQNADYDVWLVRCE